MCIYIISINSQRALHLATLIEPQLIYSIWLSNPEWYATADGPQRSLLAAVS